MGVCACECRCSQWPEALDIPRAGVACSSISRPGCWKLNSGITHVLNHRAHLSSPNLKVKGLNECSVEEIQYTKTRSTAMVFINLSTSFYNYIWQTFLPMLRIQHRPGICQGKSFITELSPGPHNIFWAVI